LNVLITGVTGLIGSHLAKHLLKNPDFNIFGLKKWRSNEKNILSFKQKMILIEGDITDYKSVLHVLRESKPDIIFHLAAHSYPKESEDAPFLTFHVNIIGTTNLFEALKELQLKPKVHIACSSAAYGEVPLESIPIKEDELLNPLTPYGISKIAQEKLGFYYFKNAGIPTYMTRFFNQIGPGQNERSSVQTFCKQIAMIEKGIIPPILKVGNLDAKRDFTDVRDTVRALELLMEKGMPGEVYNIGSGGAITIREILAEIINKTNVKVGVQIDPKRLRKNDEPILLGDISKFQKDTGWTPRYQIEETIDSILNYWRENV
jgi:GDP-4-dehydro-6-deoxy-D-mannose reductase